MSYSCLFSILALLVNVSQSQPVFPARIPGVTIDPPANSFGKCVYPSVELIKQNISEIISQSFPPLNSCNCSQLMDRTRNVSCITECCGEGRLIFNADLNDGNFYLAPRSGLTWSSTQFDPSTSKACDKQAVLRIDFREACNFTQNCKLRFDFVFRNNTGWNFNIGDSRSNNGNGGDGGDTSNAAEVHNIHSEFRVFTNTLPGYTSVSTDGGLFFAKVNDVVAGNFTVVIGDEFVMFDDHNGVQKSYRSRYLFTLNGQPTTYGPVDYFIYFGMNRVISSNGRSGTGLCSATIKVLPC